MNHTQPPYDYPAIAARGGRITVWSSPQMPHHWIVWGPDAQPYAIPANPALENPSRAWAQRTPYRGNAHLNRIRPRAIEPRIARAAHAGAATDGQ